MIRGRADCLLPCPSCLVRHQRAICRRRGLVEVVRRRRIQLAILRIVLGDCWFLSEILHCRCWLGAAQLEASAQKRLISRLLVIRFRMLLVVEARASSASLRWRCFPNC
jgi:hypothetical protein